MTFDWFKVEPLQLKEYGTPNASQEGKYRDHTEIDEDYWQRFSREANRAALEESSRAHTRALHRANAHGALEVGDLKTYVAEATLGGMSRETIAAEIIIFNATRATVEEPNDER